jgi:Phage tail lysozyme
MSLGLVGVGFGLLGSLLGLGADAGLLAFGAAGGVMEGRRRAMAMGVTYGQSTAFDIAFSRFGFGQDTLGAASTGFYDISSPERVPFLALRQGMTDPATAMVALLKALPGMMAGVPQGQYGAALQAYGLAPYMDTTALWRFTHASPDERNRQIDLYYRLAQTLNIPQEDMERIVRFRLQMEESGLVLQGRVLEALAPVAPQLGELSVHVMNAFIALMESPVAAKAISGVDEGLRWLLGELDNGAARSAMDEFTGSIAGLKPWVDRTLRFLGIAKALGGPVVRLFMDPGYNPSLEDFLKDLAGGLVGALQPSGISVYEMWRRGRGRAPQDELPPGWVPPTPQKFALGGIVTKPTVAMIGENGPEMVVPLDRMGGLGFARGHQDVDSMAVAKHLARDLMQTYHLSQAQTAGVLGSLGWESGQFKEMQELGAAPGQGGWGWAQWTGRRRAQFVEWLNKHPDLHPASYQANWGFLQHELSGEQAAALAAVKKTRSVREAESAWTKIYENPGVPAYAGRDQYGLMYHRELFGSEIAENDPARPLAARHARLHPIRERHHIQSHAHHRLKFAEADEEDEEGFHEHEASAKPFLETLQGARRHPVVIVRDESRGLLTTSFPA